MYYKKYQYYMDAPKQVKEIIEAMDREGVSITIKNVIKRCKTLLLEVDSICVKEYITKYQ